MRSAACNAERTGKDEITERDVEEGYEAISEIKKNYEMERLTPHHRLVVRILKQRKQISSSDFYEIYKRLAKKQELTAKSRRSFNNYIRDRARFRLKQ